MSYLCRNNLQEFCRICLNRLPDQSAASDPPVCCYNIHTLPTLSRQLVYLVTLENGSGKSMGFPDYICQHCFDMINNFKKFHVMALRSKQLFQSILTDQCDTQVLTANAKRYIENASARDAERVSAQWGIDPLLDASKRMAAAKQQQQQQEQQETKTKDSRTSQLGEVNSNEFFTDVAISTSDLGGIGVDEIFSSVSLNTQNKEREKNNGFNMGRAVGGGANEEATSSHATTSALSANTTHPVKFPLSGQNTLSASSSKAIGQQTDDTRDYMYLDPLKCTHCGTFIYSTDNICGIYENAGKPILCVRCKKQFSSRDPTPSRLHTLGMRVGMNPSKPSLRNPHLQRSKIMSSCSLPATLSARQQARRYICKECGMRIPQHELRSHMRKHQLRMQRKLSLNDCESCYSQSTHINSRISQSYFQECDEPPCSCRDCCKGYAVLEHRRSHVRQQLDRLPQYVCSFCSRRCFTYTHLLRHEKRHYGSNPYICNACNKGFRIRKDLVLHVCAMKTKKGKRRSTSAGAAAAAAGGDGKMSRTVSGVKLKKPKSIASNQSKVKVMKVQSAISGNLHRRETRRNKAVLRVNALASAYQPRDVTELVKGYNQVRKARQPRAPSVYNVKFVP